MRILILSLYYSPDLSAGSFRCTALVNHLKKLNFEIDVISTIPNRYSTFMAEASEFEEEDGVRIHRILLPSHNNGMIDQIKAYLTYYRGVQKIIKSKKFDLVFATSGRLFTAFLAARIAKSRKLPLYLDIRDIFVDTIKDVLPRKVSKISKPIFELIEKYTFNSAKRINLVSAGFSNYFNSRYPNVEYRFFTNGIDQEFIEAAQHSVVEKKANHPPRILYAGNIGEGQGLHTIIPQMALELGNAVQFRVVGGGGRQPQLQKLVTDLNNVEMLPPMNRAQLITEYQEADILFLHLNDYPAFTKVLPSKIFEYAALGKPILAGVAGYAADFLNTNVSNCAVFYPSDLQGALTGFLTLKLEDTPRPEFIEVFDRKVIMERMAHDILQFAEREVRA